jgi:hypothetical protein
MRYAAVARSTAGELTFVTSDACVVAPKRYHGSARHCKCSGETSLGTPVGFPYNDLRNNARRHDRDPGH